MAAPVRPAHAFEEDAAAPPEGLTQALLRNARERGVRRRKLQRVVEALMPHAVVPCEVIDGGARALLGSGTPRVRLRVRDRARLKWLLLTRDPVLAMARAYASGALEVESDILDAARLRKNLGTPTLRSRLRIARRLLRW